MSTSLTGTVHHLPSAAVVVGIDGSENSDLAVQWAAETAAQRDRRLLIVHAMDLAATQAIFGMYDLMVPAVAQSLREEGAARLAAATRLAREVDSELRIDTELSPAHPATVLIEHSESAHLVVLGAGRGGPFAHVGSTLLAVTAHGHNEIVVVRDTGSEQRTRREGPVVVGVDGSPAAETAVGAAFTEAGLRATTLVAVHAAGDNARSPRYRNYRRRDPRTRNRRAAAAHRAARGLAGKVSRCPGHRRGLFRRAGQAPDRVVEVRPAAGGRQPGSWWISRPVARVDQQFTCPASALPRHGRPRRREEGGMTWSGSSTLVNGARSNAVPPPPPGPRRCRFAMGEVLGWWERRRGGRGSAGHKPRGLLYAW